MPSKISPKGRKIRTARRLASRRKEQNEDTHLPPYTAAASSIQKQVYLEYNLAWNFMRPKIQKWLLRLKLYNNQKRDDEKVGEPLIYNTMQGVLSVLYGDKLAAEFGGRLENEADQADNLNILRENDIDEMRKDELDYDWDFDAAFFGRGLCLMNDFDTESKTPIPTIIDPTTFIRNPGAKSVNGNRNGEGCLLFGGYEVRLTKAMMEANPKRASNPNGYFNLQSLVKTNDLFSLSGESARLRREAQGLNDIYTFENSVVENYEYSVLRWFTHIGGKKKIVELANNRMLVIRIIDWDKNYWPIADRPFSPVAHDWDGVSIPDLVEDKQRFKAVILNDLGDIVKSEVKPMTLFHEERFRKTQDFTIKWGKWLPVRGPGPLSDAAMPLQRPPISATVKYVLDYLDSSAKTATATSDINLGAPQSKDQTLGETELQTSGAGNRHSLTARIWGWSEKEFWRQWYFIYDDFFAEGLGQKIATFEGPFGPQWIPIKRKDIITGNTLGPKIKVESKAVSEAQKLRQFQMMQGFVEMVVADPTVNTDKTYLYRKLGRLQLPKQEVERILPLSPDEQLALEENKKLNDEEMPKVLLAQDHNVHLRIHATADDNPTTRRHIEIHRFMLMQKRQFPQSFPQLPGENPSLPGTNVTPNRSQVANTASKISTPPQAVSQPAPIQ